MVPMICFAGRHNSGKTTLITKIINQLSARGINTAVVKYARGGLDIDGSKDSEKLFTAGAQAVYTSSAEIDLIYRRHAEERSLEEIYQEISGGVDLIIIEGYKLGPYPKIEVIRREIDPQPMELNNVIARVSNFELQEQSVPRFNFEQVDEVIELIIDMAQIDKNN